MKREESMQIHCTKHPSNENSVDNVMTLDPLPAPNHIINMSVLNLSGDEAPECPLCMELFELDDINFYPCSCGYQVYYFYITHIQFWISVNMRS